MGEVIKNIAVGVLSDPETWAMLVMGALALWRLLHAKSAARADALVRQYAPVAFAAVEEAKRRGVQIPDKTELFLQKLNAMLKGDGVKLTPALTARAVGMADAIHLSTKAGGVPDPLAVAASASTRG